MKIEIITCHDVYNPGASLQAYALQAYLSNQGHNAEIIDYKPEYLSRHYSLTTVNNPHYNVPLIREAYLIAKLPIRIKRLISKRKREFDSFRKSFLCLTERRYRSFEDLEEHVPFADLYIAGSDQIWNPLFPNGKDPAFYLRFVKDKKKRAAYAASIATDEIPESEKKRLKQWLDDFGFIAVREQSAKQILADLRIYSVQVCDPVFLLPVGHWEGISKRHIDNGYIFVYDFDKSAKTLNIAKKLNQSRNKKIYSYFSFPDEDIKSEALGPREFLGILIDADIIISSSFHATAFALLFHKEFYVIERSEKINIRMTDLLERFGLQDRLVHITDDLDRIEPINWKRVEGILAQEIMESKAYLDLITGAL